MLFVKKSPRVLPEAVTRKEEGSDYFIEAAGWHYDRYGAQEVTAHRWLLAFGLQTVLSLLLGITIVCLFPLKTWEPIVIEKDLRTGETFVTPIENHKLPSGDAFLESDLVRYVIARETYARVDAGERYQQVLYSSTPDVGQAYKGFLDPKDETAISNVLGLKGVRTVKIEDVVFLDAHKGAAPKLAKVDFVTQDTVGQTSTERHWVATLAWEYLGTPNTKAAAWINWNGFTVTSYRVDQRNV